MEKVPGVPLSQVWDPRQMTSEEMTRIHSAFRRALECVPLEFESSDRSQLKQPYAGKSGPSTTSLVILGAEILSGMNQMINGKSVPLCYVLHERPSELTVTFIQLHRRS